MDDYIDTILEHFSNHEDNQFETPKTIGNNGWSLGRSFHLSDYTKMPAVEHKDACLRDLFESAIDDGLITEDDIADFCDSL